MIKGEPDDDEEEEEHSQEFTQLPRGSISSTAANMARVDDHDPEYPSMPMSGAWTRPFVVSSRSTPTPPPPPAVSRPHQSRAVMPAYDESSSHSSRGSPGLSSRNQRLARETGPGSPSSSRVGGISVATTSLYAATTSQGPCVSSASSRNAVSVSPVGPVAQTLTSLAAISAASVPSPGPQLPVVAETHPSAQIMREDVRAQQEKQQKKKKRTVTNHSISNIIATRTVGDDEDNDDDEIAPTGKLV